MKFWVALLVTGLSLFGQSKIHVGVVTGTAAQSWECLRGAEALVREYGDVDAGGMIRHLTYPDDFMFHQDIFISQVVSLADDPDMKAIVVNQAIPGTAEAFKQVHAKRPEIYCLAGDAAEDPADITGSADLTVTRDFVAQGYTIIWAAKQMGAKTFVHLSFPRHMSYQSLRRRRLIMEEACKDLEIKFAFETAPDPAGSLGWVGSSFPTFEKVPAWLKKYAPNGERVAFFCTNDAHTEPLLKQLLASKNGLFVQADLPSPLMGYPGALGLDCTMEAEDFPAILKKVESGIVAKGGAGRFGTWAYSYGYSVSAGLGEFAIRVAKGSARKNNLKDLLAAYAKWTPGANWNGHNYTDFATGVPVKNLFLVYMDTYILGGLNGKPFLPTASLKVPGKYLTLKE